MTDSELDDLPPIDRALAVLGPERVDKRADGTYLLDGIPVGNAALVAAANQKLVFGHQPPIFYPGVWPKPDPVRPTAPPPPAPATEKISTRPQKVGRWSFLSAEAAAGGVISAPFEELDELAGALNRVMHDDSAAAWDIANARVDVAFKKVCQFMRDRSPRRVQQPAPPAGEGT